MTYFRAVSAAWPELRQFQLYYNGVKKTLFHNEMWKKESYKENPFILDSACVYITFAEWAK